jgi:prepilin-type N-terminal cleavage/methylation domain-containing protein
MLQKKRKGVTLIELLIVVVILAALAAIALPRISQSANNAKQNACNTNRQVINTASEAYFVANGKHPADIAELRAAAEGDYFPDGPPQCPVDNIGYNLVNGRVDATEGVTGTHLNHYQ